LSQWLGTDLDYKFRICWGAPDDLSKGKYKESLGEQSYRLDDLANDNTKKTFYISAADFSVQNKKLRRQRKEG
jgi:hypothetical protein